MAGAINDPADIKVAQRLLSTLDYGVLLDTGVLDDKTKQAVKKARADLKLPMSVNVDDQLLEALSKERATRGVRNVTIALGVAALVGTGAYWLVKRSRARAETAGAQDYEPEAPLEDFGSSVVVGRARKSYLGEGETPFERAGRKFSEASMPQRLEYRALSVSLPEAAKKEPSFYERHKETGLVFGRGFVDEAALGLVDPVIDYSSTEEERQAWKAAKERHRLANITGRAGGFGTSLLWGGGEVKAAATGGRLAARAVEGVATRGAEKVALRGAEKAAVRAAEGATETAAARAAAGASKGGARYSTRFGKAASVAARAAKLKAAGWTARVAEELALHGGEDVVVEKSVEGISRGAKELAARAAKMKAAAIAARTAEEVALRSMDEDSKK